MNDALKSLCSSKKIIFCIRAEDEIVEYQNSACIRQCGDIVGHLCPQKCLKFRQSEFGSNIRNDGATMVANQELDGVYYDIVFIQENEKKISILCPLEDKIEADLKYLDTVGLTKREFEIAQLVVQGKTNKKIAEILHISKSTLKTHLNRIYQKIPNEVIVRWRNKD